MSTAVVTVTPAQAQRIAELVRRARKASDDVDTVVRLLGLGHVPPTATLADVNVATGALTFTLPPAPDEGVD